MERAATREMLDLLAARDAGRRDHGVRGCRLDGGDQAAMSVATSYGALSLYLDFINLFQFLMSLLGSRR